MLESAANAADIDVVRVTSGSQPGTTGCSTGSTRHNNGRAADLQLVKNGSTLRFTDQSADPAIAAFVTAAAAHGATGIGAGVNYMGPRTVHIGFGTTPQDTTKLVWGAGGASANAPAWLRQAAQAGWSSSASRMVVAGAGFTGGGARYEIAARGGLHLRKGPGLDFGITTTISTGTGVFVLAFDGSDGAWARVDLEGDGLIDGHLLAAFLKPLDPDESEESDEAENETAAEP